MKLAVLSYSHSRNFGDEIQNIAAARLLPRVDLTISRERLKDFYSDEKCMLVMNGWFGNHGGQFPPAECIVPLYISFHIAKDAPHLYTTPECIAHFKKYAPIGCRDRGTMEILRRAGVDAYYSKCLTLTLPARNPAVAADNIVSVDIKRPRIQKIWGAPPKPVVVLSHEHDLDALGGAMKSQIAEELLQIYRNAGLVITSRLHCALPCAALGVPVLYFGVSEYRTSILSDIGITMYRPLAKTVGGRIRQFGETRRLRSFPWRGEVVSIETEKEKLISVFQEKLNPFL